MVRTICLRREMEASMSSATGRWKVEALSLKVPFTEAGIPRNEAMQDLAC